MKRFLIWILLFFLLLLNGRAFAATGCSYPTSLDSWSDKSTGDFLTIADVNQRTCAIEKLEALHTPVSGGVALTLSSVEQIRYTSAIMQPSKGSANALAYALNARKSRGTVASPTVITTGDELFSISGYGYVGATNTYIEAVKILLVSEGTISDTSTGIGGIFAVYTRSAGGSLSERLRVSSSGVLAVGTTLITGLSAGNIIVPNTKTLQSVNADGTGVLTLIGRDTGNLLILGGTRAGAAVPGNFAANFYINWKDENGSNIYVPAMNAGW